MEKKTKKRIELDGRVFIVKMQDGKVHNIYERKTMHTIDVPFWSLTSYNNRNKKHPQRLLFHKEDSFLRRLLALATKDV